MESSVISEALTVFNKSYCSPICLKSDLWMQIFRVNKPWNFSLKLKSEFVDVIAFYVLRSNESVYIGYLPCRAFHLSKPTIQISSKPFVQCPIFMYYILFTYFMCSYAVEKNFLEMRNPCIPVKYVRCKYKTTIMSGKKCVPFLTQNSNIQLNFQFTRW